MPKDFISKTILLCIVIVLGTWAIAFLSESQLYRDSKNVVELVIVEEANSGSTDYIRNNDISVETFFKTINYINNNKLSNISCHIENDGIWYSIHDPDDDNRMIIESKFYHNYLDNEIIRSEFLISLIEWIDVINEFESKEDGKVL